VLQGVLALRMHGLYAVAIIKKKRYWPKHIDGDFITTGVANLPLGTCVAQLGKARRGPFEFPFYLVALRDSNHVVLAMATQGTTLPTGKLVHRGPLSFRRPAVIDNYYISRHSVDDNNNLRQGHRGGGGMGVPYVDAPYLCLRARCRRVKCVLCTQLPNVYW
jgi:hypothetical protein